MVASAVIISSHTTSVRAANLLASFVLLPTAAVVQLEPGPERLPVAHREVDLVLEGQAGKRVDDLEQAVPGLQPGRLGRRSRRHGSPTCRRHTE